MRYILLIIFGIIMLKRIMQWVTLWFTMICSWSPAGRGEGG